MDIAHHYLQDVRGRMRGVKQLADSALAQLPSADWHTPLAEGGNSVAVLIQHLSGNMHSRWHALRGGYTANAEGESASRDRDQEFTEGQQTPAELLARWEDGWAVFLDSLDHLEPDDLARTLTIRHEPHTVLEAIQRQVAHYSGHVHQIILIVKTLRGPDFQTLSIPRGGSAAFNQQKMDE